MKRDAYKEPRIDQITFEYGFAPKPLIEKLAFDFFSDLKDCFENDFSLTKPNDNAPLHFPRFLLQGRHRKALDVSIINAVFKMKPDISDKEQIIKTYRNISSRVFNYLKDKKDLQLHSFASSVHIVYSLKDFSYPIADEIYDSFFKTTKPANLNGVSFTLVQHQSDYSLKSFIDSFEVRQASLDKKDIDQLENKVVLNNKLYVSVSPSSMELKDKGLALKLTIKTLNDALKQELLGDSFQGILDYSVDRINNFASEVLFPEA